MNHGIKHISIPQPCAQNWADMDVVERGRFCQSCQKTVTDFSRMSNDEILRSLSASGNACGRITLVQLQTINTSIAVYQPSRFSWRKLSIAAIVVSVLSLFRADAKVTEPKSSSYQTFSFKKDNVKHNGDEQPRIITGKIVDENNELVPGVTIRVKGTNNAVATNINGTFSIKIPANKRVKLQILYIGYKNIEVKIKPKDGQRKLDFKLEPSVMYLGGLGVVYTAKTPMT